MTFNVKFRLTTNSINLLNGQADINLNDTMALCTGQMMMMGTAADTIMMSTIRELNTVQQPHIHQHLHRTIDRCPSQARLTLAQLLPEIINREIGTASSMLYQSLGNELAW